jgi:hypothetical protein
VCIHCWLFNTFVHQIGDAEYWWSHLSPHINSARRVSPSLRLICTLSLLSVHIPTLCNIKVEYFDSTHIRLHHNLITQTVAESKCLDSAISTTPTPSFRPPLTTHHQRNGSLAQKNGSLHCYQSAPKPNNFRNKLVFSSDTLILSNALLSQLRPQSPHFEAHHRREINI